MPLIKLFIDPHKVITDAHLGLSDLATIDLCLAQPLTTWQRARLLTIRSRYTVGTTDVQSNDRIR